MSALADYKLLWNAAFARRHPTLIKTAKILTAAMLVAGLAIGAVQHNWMMAWRVGFGIPLLLWLSGWTMLAIPNFALMNTPANARLVPRMRRRMVELTSAAWLLAGALALLFPFWHVAPVIVLWVISIGANRSGSRVSSVVVIFAVMWGSIARRLPPELVDALSTTPATIVLFALVALYGAWTIRKVLPNGGDQHFSQRKRQVEIIERLQSMGRKPSEPNRKRSISAYGVVLRHAIATRQQRTLMLLGLGPGAHWTAMLPFCAIVLVGGVGGHLLIGMGVTGDFSAAGWVFLLTIVFIVQGGFFGRWRQLIADSRNEIALLRLAPRCPGARQWNRTFGAELVRNGLAFCALVTLTTVVLALLNGAGPFELISVGSLSTALAMPGIAWMLRDYSTAPSGRTPSVARLLVRVVPALLAMLAGLVALLGLQMAIGWLAWVLLAVASNVIGALFAARRWKTVVETPAAFIT